MAQLEVYKLEAPPEPGADAVLLTGGEAHHLLRVRRGRPGDLVMLIDGHGDAWSGRLAGVEDDRARLEILEHHPRWREPEVTVRLGLGITKPDAFMDAVNGAVQAGVAAITPLACERTVARWNDRKRERAQRISLAAAKQCGRGLVPRVEPEQLPSPWCIQQAGAHHRLVLDPAGAPPPTVSPGDVVALAVGPEGGLTEKELEAFQAGGFTPVSLGRRRLRAETAALVSVSMLTLPLETGPREHEQQ